MNQCSTSNGNMIICTIFYQDLIGLKRLVESCNIDMVFVDGRFLGWDGEKLSTDGSREYLKSKGKRVIDAPDLIECQKRNIYIKYAEMMGYEYCIVVDSDEYIIYLDKELLESELKGDTYKYYMRQDENGFYPYYRVHRSNAYHKDRHQQVYHNGTPIFNENSPILKGIITHHDPSHRSKERQEYRQKYYESNPVR